MLKVTDSTEFTYLKLLGFKCWCFKRGMCTSSEVKGDIQCCIFCERREACVSSRNWEKSVKPCEKGFSYCYKYFNWRKEHG